ncbi:MAG: oligosaccharide flippase family protein [Pseudomonadota bacterium]
MLKSTPHIGLQSLPIGFGPNGKLFRKLAGAAVGSALVRFAGIGLSFLVGVQLARLLGPAHFGIYGTTIAIVALLAVPVQLGLPQLLTRELAACREGRLFGRMRAALVGFAGAVAAASIMIVALASVWLILWPPSAPALASALTVGLLLVPVVAWLNLSCGALRGLGHVVSAHVFDAVARQGLLAAGLFAVGVSSLDFDATTALLMQFAIGAFVLVACVAMVRRALPLELTAVSPKYDTRTWTRSAVPMAGTEILRAIDAHYPILLLGLIAGLDDVGVFRVALSVAAFVGLPSSLIATVIMPEVARLHAAREREQVQFIASASAAVIFTATALLVATIFAVGEPALTLVFGDAFAPAWLPLLLISIAYLINGYFGAAASMLNMCGGERAVTLAFAFGPPVGIATVFALFDSLGVAAVALGMIASEIAKGVLLSAAATRQLEIRVGLAHALMRLFHRS